MPSTTENLSPLPLPEWDQPAETKEPLDWANLSTIDLSSFADSPAARQVLATQLRDAVHRDGFFSVVGTGLSAEEVKRQYAIAQAFFNLDKEEKVGKNGELRCDFEIGNYFGYRACGEKKIMGTDVLDNVESVNIAKFIPAYENEPRHEFLEQFRSEIEQFSKRAYEVAEKIFVLFALILELPEDFFASRHLYTRNSEDHLRYMIYHPRTVADDLKVKNTWSRSHTDFGSLTLLWSQAVAGLQIKTFEGDWKYVRPVSRDGEFGIVCNVGDSMSFWSAGYLKSTVHRVTRPPKDQAHIHRLGLFYFVRPGDDVEIGPVAESPLLKRLGLVSEREADAEGEAVKVTGLEYVRQRVKNYHNHQDYQDKTGEVFRVGNLEIPDQVA